MTIAKMETNAKAEYEACCFKKLRLNLNLMLKHHKQVGDGAISLLTIYSKASPCQKFESQSGRLNSLKGAVRLFLRTLAWSPVRWARKMRRDGEGTRNASRSSSIARSPLDLSFLSQCFAINIRHLLQAFVLGSEKALLSMSQTSCCCNIKFPRQISISYSETKTDVDSYLTSQTCA